MNRRKLLKLATAIAAGQLIAVSYQPASAGTRFRELFARPEHLRLLGEICLEQLPADYDQLLKMAGLVNKEIDEHQLRRAFAVKRRDDFSAGRILTVQGWVMAESECALCALIALA